MKCALRRLLWIFGPLVIGVALAEPTLVKSTLPGTPRDVLSMNVDEPVMHSAIRRARAELDDFLELAASPKSQQEHFAVRVMLRERNEGEAIWIVGFKQDGTSLFAGYVDGDIHMQSRFKRGDAFTFVRGDIVDWTYTDTRKGRVYGAYTECALLTLAPADEAAKTRRDLKLDCEF
jgi:uncharacterized protein YegJ (DUF2314 family)